jgi:cytochrome c oxidase subunit 2
VLLVLGAFMFGACGSDNSIVNPKGSEARHIATVWWIMFALATFVYIVVAGFIIYASTRGRRRGGAHSTLNADAFIWLGGVLVPVLILAVLAVLTVSTTEALRKPSRHALRVAVTGHDWFWAIRYQDEDVESANEMYIPAGQPVDITLRSDDVIHSFWVPQLAGKEDVVPGQTNHLRFTPNTVGTYIGQCAEYCGIQHAHMSIRVHVLSAGDWGRWLARQQRPPGEPSSEDVASGERVFLANACAGCHAIRGTPAIGTIGPNLSDVGARATLGAGAIENTDQNMRKWIRNVQSIKPGAHMPSFKTLSDQEVAQIAAYLENLK